MSKLDFRAATRMFLDDARATHSSIQQAVDANKLDQAVASSNLIWDFPLANFIERAAIRFEYVQFPFKEAGKIYRAMRGEESVPS